MALKAAPNKLRVNNIEMAMGSEQQKIRAYIDLGYNQGVAQFVQNISKVIIEML